jgi:hypothetical protein
MGTRPLRQYYDHEVTLRVDDSLGMVVEPWLRHRRRFLESMSGLAHAFWDSWVHERDILESLGRAHLERGREIF